MKSNTNYSSNPKNEERSSSFVPHSGGMKKGFPALSLKQK
jgi:hypothetical protein